MKSVQTFLGQVKRQELTDLELKLYVDEIIRIGMNYHNRGQKLPKKYLTDLQTMFDGLKELGVNFVDEDGDQMESVVVIDPVTGRLID